MFGGDEENKEGDGSDMRSLEGDKPPEVGRGEENQTKDYIKTLTKVMASARPKTMAFARPFPIGIR